MFLYMAFRRHGLDIGGVRSDSKYLDSSHYDNWLV